jgi:hypothetical protein
MATVSAMLPDSSGHDAAFSASAHDPVVEARRRIASLSGMRRAIGVIRMWPEQACAEHECVERLRTAAELVGVRVIELDKFGYIVGTPRQRVCREDVDFVIHLHYETAKTYDAVSVAAMWNPTQFYFDWGFERYWSNQMSHDVYAYTGAPEIKKLVRASRGDCVVADMPLLNHTLADPIIPPKAHDQYRVLYCGINWEKLTNKPARHDAVLRELDKQGVLDVYGPREIRGVKLWDGYKGYKGSLPFDGRTIITKIAEAGACLVFSSDAHMRSGIMSNRLFEAMAAGAVVIGDEHPFIPAAIGNNFVCVPSSLPAQERAELIGDALRRFSRHPQEAVRLATAAQRALLESYHLCTQLTDVYGAVQRFTERSAAVSRPLEEHAVDLVVQPLCGDADVIRGRINQLVQSCRGRASVTLLVNPKQLDWYERNVNGAVQIVPVPGEQDRILGPIECLEVAGERLKSPKVAFMLGIEEVFAESFVVACVESAGHPVARVGHVLRHRDAKGNVFYDYARGASELSSLHDAALGCVIFDREWLKDRVPLQDLSWKDICRLAMIERQSVVDCPATAIVVDITDYEQSLHRFRSPQTLPVDGAMLATLMKPILDPISSSASVVACGNATAMTMEPSRGLTEENLLSTVIGMEQEKRWRLLLNLYHAVPIPSWLRSAITVTRKRLGVK